jgi:hypothetical protein
MIMMMMMIIIITTSRVRLSEVVTDLISDYLCESINGVTENINVAFLGTIDAWLCRGTEPRNGKKRGTARLLPF